MHIFVQPMLLLYIHIFLIGYFVCSKILIICIMCSFNRNKMGNKT